jgi:hypothetical protein
LIPAFSRPEVLMAVIPAPSVARRATGTSLLIVGFISAVVALPHAHGSIEVPGFVEAAALPIAYIAVAAGAALRLSTLGRVR